MLKILVRFSDLTSCAEGREFKS